MIYGLKCLIEVAMDSASISQGSHVGWCFLSLALKKPATRGLSDPSLVTYNVDPIPGSLTAPSVTIQSWSESFGNAMDLAVDRCFFAFSNADASSSDHETISDEFIPAAHASNGDNILLESLMTRLRTL